MFGFVALVGVCDNGAFSGIVVVIVIVYYYSLIQSEFRKTRHLVCVCDIIQTRLIKR